MSTSQVALGAGILLPALGAARRTANQMKASSQLRGIHQSMIVFAADNHNKLPSNMGQLIDQGFIAKDLTQSPASTTTFPPGFDKMTTDEKGKWLAEHSSFVMLCWGGNDTADGSKIAGYLKPSDSIGNGTNVVFEDNHAEYMPLDRFYKLMQEQFPNHAIMGRR